MSNDSDVGSESCDDEAGETENTESSKLSCVVGVDREEVGESAVANLGIRLKSKVRSLNILSLTKVENRSLRLSKKVVGAQDIKVVVAGADGPGDDTSSCSIAAEARLRGAGFDFIVQGIGVRVGGSKRLDKF